MLLCCRCSKLLSPQFEKVSNAMAQNQNASARASAIASKALQNPQSLSNDEIKELAASAQQAQQNAQNQNPQNQQNQQNQNQQNQNQQNQNQQKSR
jgi:uncharacterized protein YdaT